MYTTNATFNFYYILMLPKNLEKFLDAVDLQDSRDYIYEDEYMKEYWAWTTSWSKRDKNKMIIRDQFDQKKTWKACWSYATQQIINWNNVKEYASEWFEYKQKNPKYLWYWLQSSRWRPNRWSSITEQLRYARKIWAIEGWMRAITREGRKNAIDNWFYLLTWSKDCDWRKTWASGKFVYKKNAWWHMFPIVDYNEEWWIVPNSFWDDRWDKGYFTVPYEDEKYLFSTQVVIDADDTWTLKSLNFAREFDEAISLWITNGTNPDKPATRREVAVMNLRVYKMLKD